MSTTFRSDRAAEAIRATVAKVVTEELEDPGLRLVTITSCDVSHDLQNAKVYYTVFGDEEAKHQAQLAFERASPYLRRRVAQEVPMRTVPEVIFRFDRSAENAMRLDEILSGLPELKKEDNTD